MSNIQDTVLHPNQIKKLVASKTPTGRASKTDIKSEMLLKIFLKAKNTNSIGYQKFSLGYFRSLGCERTIKRALVFLVSLGYISKSIKTIHVNKKIKSILYIKLELENIITTLEKMESEKPIGGQKYISNNSSIGGQKYISNNSSIGGQKCPPNRDNIINKINYKNNPKNISNSFNDSSSNSFNNSSSITNILTNLNPPEMPFYISAPINPLKTYIQKNKHIPVEELEAELVGLMSTLSVSYTDATITSMIKYFSSKNITFDSKRKLKAYTQKLITWLAKIQTSFNEAIVSVSTLPTYYDEKYSSFAYQSNDIEATQELLNKVNELAKTKHDQETLKNILQNSNNWFNKPEILISYLVERFTKEPNIKPQVETYEEMKKQKEIEEKELNQYFRESYKTGQTWEEWKEKQTHIS
jgi:hypothetical protein